MSPLPELPEWEIVGMNTWRFKVEGGHLYRVNRDAAVCMSFVPDVDLSRYQSHLRDAYEKGFKDGIEAGKNGDGMP